MKRVRTRSGAVLAALLLQCSNPSDPGSPGDSRGPLDMATAPVNMSVVTSPQGVAPFQIDSLGYSLGEIETFAGDLDFTLQYMVNTDPTQKPREVAVSSGDTLTVCIDQCVAGKPWTASVRDPAETIVLAHDSLPTGATSYEVRHRIRFARPGKGYLGFREHDNTLGQPTGLVLVIGYTCDYIDSLYLGTDSLLWIYDTTGPSTLHLRLAGSTNAFNVGVATYGDAQPGMHMLGIGTDGSFCDTIPVASSPVSGYVLPHSTNLYLLGTVDKARERSLINPRRP